MTMKTIMVIIALVSVCAAGDRPVAGGDKLELVMSPGDKSIATTRAGTIEIAAGEGLNRSYSWDGATRTSELWPRTKRWLGSMGAYRPAPGKPWKNHNGITRGVVQEGQQHLEDKESAENWLRQQDKWYSTVFSNSGLAVSFDKVAARRQINVEVWQITIDGDPPTELKGTDDAKVRFVRAGGVNRADDPPATAPESKSEGAGDPEPDAERVPGSGPQG